MQRFPLPFDAVTYRRPGKVPANESEVALRGASPFEMRRLQAEIDRMILSDPAVIMVHKDAPYRTLTELVEDARKRPGKLTFGSGGQGSSAHLALELFCSDVQIELTHIPYKGGAPAIAALVSGEVPAYFGKPVSGLSLVQSGKLQALAVTSKSRMEVLPQVPTMIESGFKDFEVVEWNGFFLPAGTPKPIIDKLGTAVRLAVDHPEVRKVMIPKGIQPVGSGPEEFARFVQ